MEDQPLVDQAFQHLFAESLDAGGGQRVAADVLAVDHGHHVVLGPLAERHRGTGLLGGLRCLPAGEVVGGCLLGRAAAEGVRDLRFGRRRADEAADGNAQADHR